MDEPTSASLSDLAQAIRARKVGPVELTRAYLDRIARLDPTLRAYITVSQATREGARYAAVGNPAGAFTSGGAGDCNGSTGTTAVGKVCSTMKGLNLDNITDVSVTYPDGNHPGESVRVSVTYHYNYITPIQRLLNFFAAGDVGPSIPVTSTVDMRLE